MDFLKQKNKFDEKYKSVKILEKSVVPVDGKYIADISIKNSKNSPNEEYFKWQFINSIILGGLYPKEYIGVEIYLPKGNKDSKPIKIDACIFDSEEWIDYYLKWRNEKDYDAVEWLTKHLIGIIEFKKSNGKDIKKVFTSQIKGYLKMSEASYCIGMYYDAGRLYLFRKSNNLYLRYDDSKNRKKEKSTVNDLSLDIPDKFIFIPSFEEISNKINVIQEIPLHKRNINNLQPIMGCNSDEINISLLNILRSLDSYGVVGERGYEIILESLAMRIEDEKRNISCLERDVKDYLKFYITEEEKNFKNLGEDNIQEFVGRMMSLYENTQVHFPTLIRENINWTNESHIRALCSIVDNLQHYTFMQSDKTDINQIVFYQFASQLSKEKQAQFITPLNIVNFIVDIANPRHNDTVIDPTVGIADFLSSSYIRSNKSIQSSNLYGVDIDEHMIMLAELNMLLTGISNEPFLKHKPGYGSLLYKYNNRNELVALQHNNHKKGNWDNWKDGTKLKKFSVVVTNPPFGENRKFQPKSQSDLEVAELYELWDKAKSNDWIDLGVLFLENAYRILEENGRLVIVLSNSIASIDRWESVREWLYSKMRIVALFDLPENVFAETGVNTTIIVAYKPKKEVLDKLQKEDYEVFCKEIDNVGYEIRTSNRIKFYNKLYKIDENTFEYEINENGELIEKEDFTEIKNQFKEWCKLQEKQLREGFIK